MYSKGSDQIKEWMQNIAKIDKRKMIEKRKMNEEGEGNQDLGMTGKPNSQDSNDVPEEEIEDDLPSSPFDILERVRDICNRNLKDPEDDEEIEKILKEIGKEVKDYVSIKDEEEDEKVSGEQRPSQPDPNAQAPTGMSGDTGVNRDMGASGGDVSVAAGTGMSQSPMSGGQM